MWQHHIFNYYVLKQYKDNFVQNSVLLIPISYFNITRIEKESPRRYYTFLDKENIPGWNFKEYILYKYLPFFSIKNAWKIYINKDNEQFWMGKTNHSYEDFISQSEMYFSWWMDDDPDIEKGEEGFQYNIAAVSKIIDLCYSRKIIPVLVSTPQTDKLNDLHTEADFFNTFYRFTDVLKEKYSELIYLDYSQNAEYSSDYSLFFDSTHLNSKGAKKFTAQIVHDLKDAGMLE